MPAQNFTLHAGLLLGFGLVLAGSAELVVRSASALAQRAGIASFTVGFLLLGVLTSTPEMFVAFQSVIDGVPQLSMGNLLGGSILLLSLVMGVSSIILGRITLDHGLAFREIVVSSAVVAAPVAVLWDGTLTRTDGILLIAFYLTHALLLNRDGRKKLSRRRFRRKLNGVWSSITMLGVGFVGMAVSSKVMVESALVLAASFHTPPFVFGLLLLSIGTNLPEFALAFEASVLRRETVAFGDFLGSSAANTLILGILGIATPFEVAARARLLFPLVLLGSVVVFFVWALSSRRDITRIEGVGLLVFYFLFVLFELFSGA